MKQSTTWVIVLGILLVFLIALFLLSMDYKVPPSAEEDLNAPPSAEEVEMNELLSELRQAGELPEQTTVETTPIPPEENAALVYLQAKNELKELIETDDEWRLLGGTAYVSAGLSESSIAKLVRRRTRVGRDPIGSMQDEKEEPNEPITFPKRPEDIFSPPTSEEIILRTESSEDGISRHTAWVQAGYTHPEVKAQVTALYEKLLPAIELTHTATAMPECEFPQKVTEMRRMHTAPGAYNAYEYLPHLSYLLNLERKVAMESGKTDKALRACAAMLGTQRIYNAPTLLGQYERHILIERAYYATLTTLEGGRPSPGVCEEMITIIDGIELTDAFMSALKAERDVTIVAYEQVMDRSMPFEDRKEIAKKYNFPFSSRKKSAKDYHKSLASHELPYLILIGKAIQQAKLSYRELSAYEPSLEDEVRATFTSVTQRTQDLSNYYKNCLGRDSALAQLRLLKVALLLEMHRAAHGAYPSTLAEMDGYAEDFTHDPFSGKELIYKKSGKGFLLYSWGQDLDDDQGKPEVYIENKQENQLGIHQQAESDPYIIDGDIVIEIAH